MTISEHEARFAGKPVQVYAPGSGLRQAGEVAWKILLDWDADEAGETWIGQFAQFLAEPNVAEVTAFIVGSWGSVAEGDAPVDIVEALVAAREKLPALTAIFLGDITSEESEISWIVNTDVSPLLAAYPQLEQFRVRGSTSLEFGTLRHQRLKTLIIESGGMEVGVVRQALAAELPALEHLELWLGDDGYGANTTVPDLEPLLQGVLFPRLSYLGLRDSHIADDIAIAIAAAPILNRLETLDLSLGTLGDAGARALLNSPLVLKLKKLDVHHHYMTDPVRQELEGLPITVDASDPQDESKYGRFVAVSE